MAFIPTPNTVRADIQFVQDGQQIHNVIWCEKEAPWSDVERLALADAIITWWNASGKTWFSNTFALQQITVVNQDTQNAPSSVRVVSPTVPGATSGSAAPSNAAICATLRTDFRGRSYRGRMYLGGLPASAVVNPTYTTAGFVAGMITILTALKTAIDAIGAIWVVVSKWTNKVQRATGLTTNITAIAVDQYFDSQRRRLGGRGV